MDEEKPPIPFQPLLPYEKIDCYFNGLLPHWRQKGATYFVTFRTGDSLPSTLRTELNEERNAWLRASGLDPETADWRTMLGGPYSSLSEEYARRFGNRVNDLLDQGSGACLLRNPSVARMVEESLHYFDQSRLFLGDYVIMPNHVHTLITPLSDYALEDLLGSIKGVSARKINRHCGLSGAFWQRDSYDHIVRTPDSLERFQNYIHSNPEKAGLSHNDTLSGKATYSFHP